MRWFRRLAVVLLISSGVNFVMIRLLRRRYPSAGDEQSDEIALAAIGTGIDLASRATAFRGGSARAMMGGLQLDLTGATPAPEGVRLELRAVMGGINVIVPPGWRITVEERTGRMGGVDIDMPERGPGTDGATAPSLTVAASAVMGGIHVAAR